MNASITTRIPRFGFFDQDLEKVAFRPAPHILEEEVSDEDLMALVTEGNREALGVLFRRYSRLVRAVGIRILCDGFEADDMVQEVFLFIHRKGGLFDSSKGSARSWILQVTYHRAIDRRRYLQARHFYTPVNLEDVVDDQLQNPGSEESIEQLSGRTSVQTLFEGLSENQRQTMILFFFEGCTFDEIAEKLGQSRGNIKNHYFRGLERLRKQFFASRLRRNPAL